MLDEQMMALVCIYNDRRDAYPTGMNKGLIVDSGFHRIKIRIVVA